MPIVSRSMSGTTRDGCLEMGGGVVRDSAAPVSGSSCEPLTPMRSLFGDMTPDHQTESGAAETVEKSASTVESSVMRADIAVLSSFRKRTQSLITSGLIKGITPSSIRHGSRQGILATVFYELDGNDADALRED